MAWLAISNGKLVTGAEESGRCIYPHRVETETSVLEATGRLQNGARLETSYVRWFLSRMEVTGQVDWVYLEQWTGPKHLPLVVQNGQARMTGDPILRLLARGLLCTWRNYSKSKRWAFLSVLFSCADGKAQTSVPRNHFEISDLIKSHWAESKATSIKHYVEWGELRESRCKPTKNVETISLYNKDLSFIQLTN